MRWIICCVSCVFLASCTAASVDTATGSDSSRRKPERATSNTALPLLETDEAKARAQVARDIEAQPSEVRRQYYTALLAAFDRSIALDDEQLANLEQGRRDGLAPNDADQARTRATVQRTRWLEQRAAAAAALKTLEAQK